MSEAAPKNFRTPLAKVRGRGAARAGTEDFWLQRMTAVAGVPLTIMAIVIAMLLLGRNQAAVAQILGSPLVAVIMLLFVICIVTHMKIGMQEILVDYVADDSMKLTFLLANTFFCWAVGLICVYAILKMSFGV
ncbi:MAG TPA: succinate dehydrogenase, hydrophobic membrane anchor protein [Xanthobacteraceae bacterium]|jgi:succinate dehydrogenase / fumarate reductase membrane anchor subunit|nr:succinate dehydrogenase, hydrophobic membrane anchor protein [Xanthobacteraceae bacterium]